MRGLLAILLLLPAFSAWSCLVPSEEELKTFFEDSPFWTEVKNENSDELAEKRPVFLMISFTKTEGTRIRWGDNTIQGSDLSLCWKTSKRKKLQIRRAFFVTTLVKVRKGLLKSWIPIDGDLFYRKDAEVKRPSQKRELADEAEAG